MERLRILAAAVALGEFTATQLAAFSGASENTVRSVLRRDARMFGPIAHDRVAPGPSSAPAARGRPPRRHRIIDQVAVQREIESLERELSDLARAELSGIAQDHDELADRVAAVNVAMDAISRAWGAKDRRVRCTVSETALQTLRGVVPGRGSGADAPMSVTFPVLTTHGSTATSDDLIGRRALAIATLAELTHVEATGKPVTVDQLAAAARAATELHPDMPTSARWGMFLGLSRLAKAARKLPPVGVLTSADSTPADAVGGLDPSFWIAHQSLWSGHRLWSQRWAESLFGCGLVGCFVLYDEGNSDELVDTYVSGLTRRDCPTIVVSSRFDMAMARKVAAVGAMFLPSKTSKSVLTDAIINNPFLHTIAVTEGSRQQKVAANTWQDILGPPAPPAISA